jgi:hypothetical protein
MTSQVQELEHYYQLFMGSVTEDEKLVLFRIATKFFDIMTSELVKKEQVQETKKTIRKITIE